MRPLLSHLAHLEIASPDVEASVAFYVQQFGLRVVDRLADGAVRLRCWGDYYRYGLVVRPGDEPALLVMAWRTASDDALDEAAARVKGAGVSGTWREAADGHGRSYRFTGPWGHVMELYWEVPLYKAEGELASSVPDRPERRSTHGAAPRMLDHVTIATTDVAAFGAWYADVLGFREMAYTGLGQGCDPDGQGPLIFGAITANEKSHDLGMVLDTSERGGRVHHVAFWVDSNDELAQAADLLMEGGTPIEYGPSVHGIGEQTFLYFREPSGLRVELNTGGYRNYVPDWTPHVWTPSEGSVHFYRNNPPPDSMIESFPLDGRAVSATEDGALPGTETALVNHYAEHAAQQSARR